MTDGLQPEYRDADGNLYAISIRAFEEKGIFDTEFLPFTHNSDDVIELEIQSIVDDIIQEVSISYSDLLHQARKEEDFDFMFAALLGELEIDPSLETLRELYHEKEVWTQKDRIAWEECLADMIAKRTYDQWGAYRIGIQEYSGRREGSISRIIYEDQEWECEMQSIVEGIIQQRVEDYFLEEADGYKSAQPYYYISGAIQFDGRLFSARGGGHAMIVTSQGFIESTTLRYGKFYEAYHDEQRTQPTTMLERLSPDRILFFSDKYDAILGTPATEMPRFITGKEHIFARNLLSPITVEEERFNIRLGSNYHSFFPEQNALMETPIQENTVLPSDIHFWQMPIRMHAIEKTDLFEELGKAVNDALSDETLSVEEIAHLEAIVEKADSAYNFQPIEGLPFFDKNQEVDNLQLHVSHNQDEETASITLTFDAGFPEKEEWQKTVEIDVLEMAEVEEASSQRNDIPRQNNGLYFSIPM